MHLEIVTPKGSVLSESVSEVVVPAFDGLMGILEGHADLMAGLGEGTMSIKVSASELKKVALKGGGFLQIDSGKVYVLAESVELIT